MKNIIVLTFVLVLSCFLGFSQETRFSTGIEAGPSLICIKEPHDPYFEYIGVGFSTGIFIQYNMKKIFSIKLAPCFERKGNWDGYHYNYNYIVVPILLRAEIGSKVRGLITAGPYFGYLIKGFISEGSEHYILPNDVDRTKYFNSFDMGISAGLGIIVPIQKIINIGFELRNNIGLYQIVKPYYRDEFIWEEKTYSMNFLISITYNFSKRK